MKSFAILLLATSALAAPVAKPLFGGSIAVGDSVNEDIAEVEATLDDILSKRETGLFGGAINVGEVRHIFLETAPT